MKKIIFLFAVSFIFTSGIVYGYSYHPWPGECSEPGFARFSEVVEGIGVTYSSCRDNEDYGYTIDSWDIFTNNCDNPNVAGCGDVFCDAANKNLTPTAPPDNMCVTARVAGPTADLDEDKWKWTCRGPIHPAACSSDKHFTTKTACDKAKNSYQTCYQISGSWRRYYADKQKCLTDLNDRTMFSCSSESVNGTTRWKLCGTAHTMGCGVSFPTCSATIVPHETQNTDGSKDVRFTINYIGTKTVVFNPGNGQPSVSITSSGQTVGPYHYVPVAGSNLTQYYATLTYAALRENGVYYKECGSSQTSVVTVGAPLCSVTSLTATPNSFSAVMSGLVNFFARGINVKWASISYGDGQNGGEAADSDTNPEYTHSYNVIENVSSKVFTATVFGRHKDTGDTCTPDRASATVTFSNIAPSISCRIAPLKGKSPLNVQAIVENPTGGVTGPYYIKFSNSPERQVSLNTYVYGTVTSAQTNTFDVVVRGRLGSTPITATCKGTIEVPKDSTGGEVSP